MEIVTANSLGDGRVVFQTAAGWSHAIGEADVLETKEGIAAALDRANRDALGNRVVEPYAIAVKRAEAMIVPLRLRERIRAVGPTVGNSLPAAQAGRGKAA